MSKFCINCGQPLPDNAAFCAACGNKVAPTEPVAPAPQQPVYQQPVYTEPQQPVYQQPAYTEPQQPVYQQPVYTEPQQPVYQQPVYTEPQQPVYQQPVYAAPQPPKKGKGGLIAGILVALLLIGGIVGVLVADPFEWFDDEDDDDDKKTSQSSSKNDEDDEDEEEAGNDKNDKDDEDEDEDEDKPSSKPAGPSLPTGIQEAMDTYMRVCLLGEFEHLGIVTPPQILEYYENEFGETLEDRIESRMEYWEEDFGYLEDFGSNLKLTSNIDSFEPLDDDMVDAFNDYMEEDYECRPIKDAYSVTVQVKLKGSKSSEEYYQEFAALKIGSDWYIATYFEYGGEIYLAFI